MLPNVRSAHDKGYRMSGYILGSPFLGKLPHVQVPNTWIITEKHVTCLCIPGPKVDSKDNFRYYFNKNPDTLVLGIFGLHTSSTGIREAHDYSVLTLRVRV